MLMLARLGALAGAAAAAVATFIVVSRLDLGFWPLALLALVAFVAAGAVLLRLTERGRHGARAASRRWLGTGTVAYVAAAQLLVGRTPAHTLTPPVGTPGTRYWTLATGSRIAYEHVPATGAARATPVVVLHDGPGTPILPFLQALGQRPLDFLAHEGFDVYYYDQLGAGLSGRLALTREAPYTVARHVADLEAIRQAIGAESIILAGTGWGATLAVHYLREHPARVDKLMLESPGPLWPPAWPDLVLPAARARMDDVQASALAALQRPPLRLVIGRMMADVSRTAAHRFIADWEADQWWTRVTAESIRLGQPNLTCRSDPGEGIPPPQGLGFFANSYTLADAVRLPDPRPALDSIGTETLVIRGTCDYIDWQVSAEYLRVLPGAQYVSIPAAGHFIWLEQPTLYREVLGAFLRGETIPLAVYDPARRGTAGVTHR